MRLSIAGIFAKCPACAGHDFQPLIKRTAETRDVYSCTACRQYTRFADLMSQIGEEAVRRATLRQASGSNAERGKAFGAIK
jgi:hypothetical protein